MSTEIPLFGQTYRAGKLDAMKQFHLARRIAPIVTALGLSISELAASGKSLKQDTDLLAVAGPIAAVVAKMSDEETEYVIRTALAVVQRREEGAAGAVSWRNVQTGNQLQYQDITLSIMIRLVVEVLKENLGGFFGAPTDGIQSGSSS